MGMVLGMVSERTGEFSPDRSTRRCRWVLSRPPGRQLGLLRELLPFGEPRLDLAVEQLPHSGLPPREGGSLVLAVFFAVLRGLAASRQGREAAAASRCSWRWGPGGQPLDDSFFGFLFQESYSLNIRVITLRYSEGLQGFPEDDLAR